MLIASKSKLQIGSASHTGLTLSGGKRFVAAINRNGSVLRLTDRRTGNS